MNADYIVTDVIVMLYVPTLSVVMIVHANQATGGMDSNVQVQVCVSVHNLLHNQMRT